MENKKLLRQEYQRNYYYKNREQQLLNMYQYYKKNYLHNIFSYWL